MPLAEGPSSSAMPVRVTTVTLAVTILKASSCLPWTTGEPDCGIRGKAQRMSARATLTSTKAHPSAKATGTSRTAITEYTTQPSSVHHHHGSFSEHQAYTRLKAAQAR